MATSSPDRSSRFAAGNMRRFVALRESALRETDFDLALAQAGLEAGLGEGGRAVDRFAGRQVEAGGVPGTDDRPILELPFRERAAQVRAGLREAIDAGTVAHEKERGLLVHRSARLAFRQVRISEDRSEGVGELSPGAVVHAD